MSDSDNPMTELEARRWLKQVKQEYEEMEAAHIQDPDRQSKFDLSLKIMEVRFAEAKVKNMKRAAKSRQKAGV